MKKIILISDSHGNKRGVEKLLNDTSFDVLFFAGDGLKDVQNFTKPIIKVAGNCDFFSDESQEEVVNIEGLNILLTHGHLYKAKYSHLGLYNEAVKRNCGVVCFGHTHQKLQENINGVLLLNAGAFKSGNYLEIIIDKASVQSVNFKNINN